MNKNILHKIISIWTVVILLLPIGVQFVHTLENHEHIVCNSKEVSHIHEQKIDCSFCHVLLENNTVFNLNTVNLHNYSTIDITPIYVVNKHIEVYLFFNSSRAPPKFIA